MNQRSFDMGRALTFMFEEEGWVAKFLIATGMILFSFLLLPAFILMGYQVEIIRRAGREERPVLPTWDNWGQYLSEGFLSQVALVIYQLPFIVPICCFALFIIAAGESAESGELAGGIVLLFCCLMFFGLLLLIPLYLVYMVGLVRYAESRQFSSFFQVGRNIADLRANLGPYGYTLLIAILANLAGSALPFLGNAWAILVQGQALGQVLAISRGGNGPLVEEPLSDIG